MDRVQQCMDHVRVIRGVNYGAITEKQMETLFTTYKLNKKEKRLVLSSLKEAGICLSQEKEPVRMAESKAEPAPPEEKEKTDPRQQELMQKRFDSMLQECLCDLWENPRMQDLFQEMEAFLMETVASYADRGDRFASTTVAEAVVRVCVFWIQKRHKNARVCGTYLRRVSERFERTLRNILSEEELQALVDSCVRKEELTLRQQGIVLVLLYNMPHVTYSAKLTEESCQ